VSSVFKEVQQQAPPAGVADRELMYGNKPQGTFYMQRRHQQVGVKRRERDKPEGCGVCTPCMQNPACATSKFPFLVAVAPEHILGAAASRSRQEKQDDAVKGQT